MWHAMAMMQFLDSQRLGRWENLSKDGKVTREKRLLPPLKKAAGSPRPPALGKP